MKIEQYKIQIDFLEKQARYPYPLMNPIHPSVLVGVT